MEDKEIRLNLLKIFNWPKEDKLVDLEIEFYSGETSALVARRPVKATFINNYLDIGVTIKIKYNKNENYVIVVIHQIFQNSDSQHIGEAEINLDELKERKIKYFTFGGMDKVLQVELNQPKKAKVDANEGKPMKETRKMKNQRFLEERKKFLETINQNQALLKKSFSEKIFSLLNDERPAYKDNEYGYEPDYTGYNDQIPSFGLQARNMRNDRIPSNSNNRGSREWPEKAPGRASQKHKLMLNTLNIIPGSMNDKQ